MLAFERLNTTFDDNLDKLAQIKVIPRFPNGASPQHPIGFSATNSGTKLAILLQLTWQYLHLNCGIRLLVLFLFLEGR
jgi:hypothetical protein